MRNGRILIVDDPVTEYNITFGVSGSVIITNVTAANITPTSATITWNTDEPSNSLVKYGTELGNYTSQRFNLKNTTSHSITLSGLLPNTTYYFAANSTDQSGNSNQSAEYNFTASTKGDLDHDGVITRADVAIALRLAATGAHDPAADISGDDRVTSLDALMIMQAAAGAIVL